MVYILVAILIFGVLIAVHELGHFMAANPEHAGRPMRVDVMAVKLPFTIQHLENAFME